MGTPEYRRCLSVSLVLLALACVGCEVHARMLSANIQARHLPFGTILDPIFAAPNSNDIIGYTRCGDSAIWTGHYLAAESYRYKVTGSADALANAQKALAGLQSLVDVTGTDLLARCLVPMSSPFAAGITREESANGIHVSGQNFWIGHTSRDEYCGVFFGLSVAYDLLNDPGSKASIQAVVTRMLNFLLAKNWSVTMPDGSVSTTFIIRPDEQLSLLQVGRQVNPAQFASQYDSLASNPVAQFGVPLAVAVDASDSHSSYFKFNLDAISLFDLIRLEDNSSLRNQYLAAYGVFHDTVKNHGNAHFNMVDRALNGASPSRDSETVTLLNLWLQRPRRDPFVDLTGAYPACGSDACNPIPVDKRIPTDFLWQRNPFQLVGGGSGVIESAGIDYILPYWMGRYYGVVFN
jgi:hypothetical protein